jgi:4-amino-4-deoxy-L-arabinose transferase-like glycosyltransferase
MTTVTLPEAPPHPSAPASAARGQGRIIARILRGPDADPAWVRPALLGLLLVTAVLYLWGLGASGWANSFYSAAVQAGTKSWKAFFFGSSDASNFITVDKPPAALWVMELSARVFGVNAWSILVPQALEGVAAVGVLYAAVRRWFGAGAGLLAGAVLALTPVAALMFRFNNPDALLTLLLVAAAYATTRAIENGSTRWLVAGSVLVGFGFITKMMQAFVVVPALALAYLIAGPPRLGRRVLQLLMAGGALIVASFWWVVVVMAIPASDRPYIGGSQNNSLWNLIFGYNGFGRLTGNETGSVGGGPQPGSRWGATGLLRMFGSDFGTQISWLLPAALILLVAGLAWHWRAPRTDRARAALVIWGGWLVVTAVVFSLGQGIIHPYYSIALAPAIGAVVAVGGTLLWRARRHLLARLTLAAALAGTAVWAYELLGRTPTWMPWMRDVVLLAGLGVAALIAAWSHLGTRMAVGLAAAAIAVGLAAPAAYTLSTVRTAHSGALPTAGPAGSTGGPGGGPGGRPGGFRGRFAGGPGGQFGGPAGFATGNRSAGGNAPASANGVGAGNGFPGANRFAPGNGFPGNRGGGAGLLNGSQSNATLNAALASGASKYRWVAAAVGANQAAGYQLATGLPVMAIGGFNGSDPAPTLSQFEAYVKAGQIHYFIAGGMGGGPGGGGTSSQIASWVESTFTSQSLGGVTVYDLSTAR